MQLSYCNLPIKLHLFKLIRRLLINYFVSPWYNAHTSERYFEYTFGSCRSRISCLCDIAVKQDIGNAPKRRNGSCFGYFHFHSVNNIFIFYARYRTIMLPLRHLSLFLFSFLPFWRKMLTTSGYENIRRKYTLTGVCCVCKGYYTRTLCTASVTKSGNLFRCF